MAPLGQDDPGSEMKAALAAEEGRDLHKRFEARWHGYTSGYSTQFHVAQRVQLECHYGIRSPKTNYGMVAGT